MKIELYIYENPFYLFIASIGPVSRSYFLLYIAFTFTSEFCIRLIDVIVCVYQASCLSVKFFYIYRVNVYSNFLFFHSSFYYYCFLLSMLRESRIF